MSGACTYCGGLAAPFGDEGPMCPECDGSGMAATQERLNNNGNKEWDDNDN